MHVGSKNDSIKLNIILVLQPLVIQRLSMHFTTPVILAFQSADYSRVLLTTVTGETLWVKQSVRCPRKMAALQGTNLKVTRI